MEEARAEELQAIERLRGGDVCALEYLVRRYEVRALRAAYLITRDPSLAQDVVQAAFVKAYERIDQLDPSRPFAPWFLQSVVNAAITASARRDRQVSLEGWESDDHPSHALAADPAAGPEEGWERAETAAEVWEAMRRLTAKERGAIVSHYFLDLTEREAATMLACSPGTVKWRLHAARERLRFLLRPSHG